MYAGMRVQTPLDYQTRYLRITDQFPRDSRAYVFFSISAHRSSPRVRIGRQIRQRPLTF